MKQLQQTLQPFNGWGVSLRVEAGNKLFLTGADGLNQKELATLKKTKPLLMLFVPMGRNYRIRQILTAIKRVIDHASLLIIDGGYDQHGADLRALPIGYKYLESIR